MTAVLDGSEPVLAPDNIEIDRCGRSGAYIQKYTYIHIHYIQKYTYIQYTYVRTYILTYIHTYVHTYVGDRIGGSD